MKSLNEPSDVRTIARLEWFSIIFSVPILAASLKSIGSSNQGVFTNRGPSSFWYPKALGITNPTESTILKFILISPMLTLIASDGTNLGSTVIICFPADVWGSSSKILFFK